MLYTLWLLAGLLMLLWVIGVAGAFAVGGGVHVLLLGALMAVSATLIARPRVL